MTETVQTGGQVAAPPGQLDLLPPGESDAAFFLSSEQLRKRYTATQVREVEGKRELILMCIAAGFQWDYIAEKARVSSRTVTALAARDAEKVAGNLKEFGLAIRATAARWYGLARGKEHEASFIQLAQAASFALQRSNEIEVIAGMGEVGEKESSIASGGPDPCAGLRQLLAAKAPQAQATGGDQAEPKPGSADGTSGAEPAQPVEGEDGLVNDVVHDAGGPTVPSEWDGVGAGGQGADQGEADQGEAEGAGGGSQASGSAEFLDTSERTRNFGKGDPS